MKNLRVLVGDDQIGVEGGLHQEAFLRNYGELVKFDFEKDPERFIGRARVGKYDALLIDLNWEEADFSREYKTGYRVLEAVRDYAPIRLLHTSEDEVSRMKGLQYGATGSLEKYRSRKYLEEALKGGGK